MKYFITFLFLPFLLFGFGCTDDLPEDQQIDYEEDVKPLIEETTGHKVRGSCSLIDSDSHCLDYIGSIWTEQQMKLNCEGAGIFSFETCPYSENGGCLNGRDTVAETVIWSYPYGGQPISGEELKYEVMACDALAAAEWVTPDSLFLE